MSRFISFQFLIRLANFNIAFVGENDCLAMKFVVAFSILASFFLIGAEAGQKNGGGACIACAIVLTLVGNAQYKSICMSLLIVLIFFFVFFFFLIFYYCNGQRKWQ